jgi:hypothetical protein
MFSGQEEPKLLQLWPGAQSHAQRQADAAADFAECFYGGVLLELGFLMASLV